MSLVVLGSLNHDVTVAVEEFPSPGETVLASSVSTATGGKSSNQAAAAALAGAATTLVARRGDDPEGVEAIRGLDRLGVDVSHVAVGRARTGTAHITVRADGENTIVVVPGANDELVADDCAPALLAETAWVLLGLEVPVSSVVEVARRARASGTRVALNLSPVPASVIDLVDVDLVVVNEGEAAAILGREVRADADEASSVGVEHLVVTRGPLGALLFRAGTSTAEHVPGRPVTAVDTTGCGDAFAGVLVGRLAAGDDIALAAERATLFASDAATRPGAQSSYPHDMRW